MFFGGNPFGGNPFGGDIPGMPGRPGGGSVDNEEFYKVLEIKKDANERDIKKAYRKLAQKFHPDKPKGDETKFKQISEAYEVLSDLEKRQKYDQFGKDAVTGNGAGGAGGGADPFDMFSSMFGGGMRGRSRRPQERKMKPTVHQIGVTLDDFYKGKTIRIAVTRKRIKLPTGMSMSDAFQTCQGCRGTGVRVQMRQIGPGMIQQSQGECDICNGSGQIQKPGVTIEPVKKTLEINVDRGMKHGDKVVFEGEGDEKPGIKAGDIVIVLAQKDHDVFKRSGHDLVVQRKITLVDALCGINIVINHLDGRPIRIQSPEEDTITPRSIHVIEQEGMPKKSNPTQKGDLYIQFEVQFPKKVNAGIKTKLRDMFGTSEFAVPGECDEYVCKATNLTEVRDKGNSERGRSSAVDSDDEDNMHHEFHGMPGGQNVQCAQQ